jgi:hypothetical protein
MSEVCSLAYPVWRIMDPDMYESLSKVIIDGGESDLAENNHPVCSRTSSNLYKILLQVKVD